MKGKGVKVILVNELNEIFLLHRDNKPGLAVKNKWSFVGGHVDEGETPEEAVVRETKEEIDFDLKAFSLFKIYENPDVFSYVFVGKINKKLFELTLYEGNGMGFFTIEDALEMNISKNTKKYIEEYFNKN